MIRECILSVIGGTPLVEMHNIFRGRNFRFFAKLEQANPGGSMKDRPALNIIRHGMETGAIRKGTIVIESSSGNMGIGLAQVCAYYRLPFICVVDKKTTAQNINLLKAYNARVEIICEPDESGEYLPMRIRRVKELLAAYENSFWPNQYANECNSAAHHQTMHEIVTTLNGKVDYLFCAISTCGTLRGCAEYKKQHQLPTRIIAVDAQGSVIFGGPKAKRLIPGHGASMVPELFRKDLADECVHVTDLDCVVGCHRLVQEEAVLAGGSSGAVVHAVERLLPQFSYGANCVAILPDRGERYLDTIYSPQWVREHFGEITHLWQEPMEMHACAAQTY